MKKIRKEILIILILFFIIFTLFYFFRINKSLTKVQTLNKKFQTKTKIGVIFGYGGLGDKSFNDMQYNGVIKAKNMFNIDITYYAPKDKNDIINKINQFVGEGMKYIIVGEGYDGLEVIKELAQIYKNIHFILLDNKFDKYLNNMSSVLFKQNEVSFLVGALSSLVSKKKSILFFGGMNLDVIDDFYVGFEQGAKYVVSDIKINKVYFSDYIESEKVWNSPKEAFEVIDNLYNKMKFDIVYAVAAGTNLGVFNACKKNNIFSIGVDADQDYLVPGVILTSAMKRLDNAIVLIIDLIINNKLEPKNYVLGLKEGCVSLTEMKYTKEIIGEKIIGEIEKIKEKIVNGEIKVKTVFNY